jgi:proline iminopeptidase
MSVPSLWTCGRHDEATPDSTASFQARTPNSELAVFEDSSHMAHFEEPESYLKTVADFLLRADER